MLREAPYCDAASPYFLHKALVEREPPVNVTYSSVKEWWKQYREGLVEGASVGDSRMTALRFEEQYGERVRPLVPSNRTAYKLARAMATLNPPVFASDGVLKQWIHKYSGCDFVNVTSCADLEDQCGAALREAMALSYEEMVPVILKKQLCVSKRVCDAWLARDWTEWERNVRPRV